eukprot:Skav230558  [mRNA]  locus=scaffold1482:11805:12239:- [translate_table: standard]
MEELGEVLVSSNAHAKVAKKSLHTAGTFRNGIKEHLKTIMKHLKAEEKNLKNKVKIWSSAPPLQIIDCCTPNRQLLDCSTPNGGKADPLFINPVTPIPGDFNDHDPAIKDQKVLNDSVGSGMAEVVDPTRSYVDPKAEMDIASD